MNDVQKYQGVIPAFYACYDETGEISPERVRTLTRHLVGRVHLPKRRRAEDGSGKRNGRGTGAPYGDRSCSLQQYP